MRRLPKDIRKYCKDQRFTYSHKSSYEEMIINFRITNIAGEYNDKNPLKSRSWEDININIVVDGTVSRVSDNCIMNTQTLEDLNITGKIDYTPSKIKSLKLDED